MAPAALRAAARVLKPDGTLRLSVPDFRLLSNMMDDLAVPTREKASLMTAVFGAHGTRERLDRVGPIANALGAFLKQAGFRAVQRFPAFGLFDDLSHAKRFGLGISLNIEATKERP